MTELMELNFGIIIDGILGIAFVCLWWRQNYLYAKQTHSKQEEELLTRKISNLGDVRDRYAEFKLPTDPALAHNKEMLRSSLKQAKLIFSDKKIVDAISEITEDETWHKGFRRGSWNEVEQIIDLMNDDVAKNRGNI